jgi:hypothetical protein
MENLFFKESNSPAIQLNSVPKLENGILTGKDTETLPPLPTAKQAAKMEQVMRISLFFGPQENPD